LLINALNIFVIIKILDICFERNNKIFDNRKDIAI